MTNLFVQDKNDVETVAPDMQVRRGPDDCDNPENGPGGQPCQNALCVDTIKFDRSFTCDCTNLVSSVGGNCGVPSGSSASASDNSGTAAGVSVVFLLLIGGALVAAYVLNERRKARKVPHDFEAQLQKMINEGMIKVVKDADGNERAARIPMEIPRNEMYSFPQPASRSFWCSNKLASHVPRVPPLSYCPCANQQLPVGCTWSGRVW